MVRGHVQGQVVSAHFAWDGSARPTYSEDALRDAVDVALADEVLGS